MQAKSQNNKVIRKPGRTLLYNSEQSVSTNNFTGLLNTTQTNNNSTFLVFDTIDNSKAAFKQLKANNVKVRFAHYRVFFTINGIDESVSYNDLKTNHIQWITSNTNGNVLFYKQYRKNGKFIGCGDFTIDTKESMDMLLNKDTLKQYSFDKYTGVYYRYNKKTHLPHHTD